jgi:probable HAF family extracellular repeat protein
MIRTISKFRIGLRIAPYRRALFLLATLPVLLQPAQVLAADVIIRSAGVDKIQQVMNGNDTFFISGVEKAILTVATLNKALRRGNAFVVASPNGQGDILVQANVFWNTPYTLTLTANRDIVVGRNVIIASKGKGGLRLRADNTGLNDGTVRLAGNIDFSHSTGGIEIRSNGFDVANITTNPAAPNQLVTGTAKATFQGLGFLPGMQISMANAISGNGFVVAGLARNAASDDGRAFRWSNGTMTALDRPTADWFWTSPDSVNHNGAVIVGSGIEDEILNTPRALRWVNTAVGEIALNEALAVSADGRTLVGNRQSHSPFPWKLVDDVASRLGTSSGTGTAYDVSANGAVIVGTQGGWGVRWSGSSTTILDMAAGNDATIPQGVSSNGLVIVGYRNVPGGPEKPLRWVGDVSSVLPCPGGAGNSGRASATNTDGYVTIGSCAQLYGRWLPQTGWRSINDMLSSRNLASGWTALTVSDISADGSVMVGAGQNTVGQTEGWIAHFPAPPPRLSCGTDKKICPGGVKVSRKAPYCEFAACPAN